jgi:MoaA/NifB/PqqE/SkfB family radical SAM enzyme
MNSDIMQGIRTRMLAGDEQDMCSACYYEDKNNKLSGRARQLLKSAVTLTDFEHAFCASPHWEEFKHSHETAGHTNNQPVDLQIDLGNTCNSACVMCTPIYSSRLATDYVKLSKLNPVMFAQQSAVKNWTDDPAIVAKFVQELKQISNIRYIHFLGGETLYLRSFYDICNQLIDAGLAKDISLGTTTNCTVYTDELEYIIKNFKEVHLGLSVEAIHKVNDYVRYPSDINKVVEIIDKFINLRNSTNLHLSLRITPNILSVLYLDQIFEFMLSNDITAESCNILHEPSCLRIELLSLELLQETLDKINSVINQHQLRETAQIINRRDSNRNNEIITNVIFEYKTLLESYLTNYVNLVPQDLEQERYNLVKFIKAFESIRNNSILEVLPEYEEFLRRYGY